jgi:hypothetical protein
VAAEPPEAEAAWLTPAPCCSDALLGAVGETALDGVCLGVSDALANNTPFDAIVIGADQVAVLSSGMIHVFDHQPLDEAAGPYWRCSPGV